MPPSAHQLRLSEKLGYGLGDCGANFVFRFGADIFMVFHSYLVWIDNIRLQLIQELDLHTHCRPTAQA